MSQNLRRAEALRQTVGIYAWLFAEVAFLASPVPCLAENHIAAEIPLPPHRPPGMVSPPAGPPSELCIGIVRQGLIEGDSLPSVVVDGGCGISDPVLLKALLLPGGGKVVIEPPALMRCTLAAALADWVGAEIAPEIAREGDRLARIAVAGAYECRGRNRVADAKLSEHASGNALDIAGFVTMRGQSYVIARQSDARLFFRSVQRSACQRFMTVLGPGSDGFHETHLHVDLQQRGSGSHYCHWMIE